MDSNRQLPTQFLRHLEFLEQAYLAEEDRIRQSGFSGGAERWRAEREPILDAVDGDGDFLDIGCANGYLLECLVRWAGERGLTLMPFGLDQGARLVELARLRLPRYRSNFYVGNGWDWDPPRQFRYVYTLYDCVPLGYLEEYVRRLLRKVVAPGGRLIVGAYGSKSRGTPPFDVRGFLFEAGIEVWGTVEGGEGPIAKYTWVDKKFNR